MCVPLQESQVRVSCTAFSGAGCGGGGLRCRGREAATKGPERSGTDPRVCVVLALAEGSVWLIVPFFTVL